MKAHLQKCSKFIQIGLFTSLILSSSINAQQDVEFSGGIPLAPTGLANFPLAEGPFEYQTGEGMDIRVVVVARGIELPTSMAFLPDNKILVSTRPGLFRIIEDGVLSADPVNGGPEAVFRGASGSPGAIHGYMDIALHPQFEQNNYVYLSYTKPLANDVVTVAVGRGRWNGEAITDFADIWQSDPGNTSMTRLTFDLNNMLYFSTSGSDPQDISTVGGKIMRVHDDGRTPADNPFVGLDNARPEIYSFGHRNTLGLAVHPASGAMWQNENGPNGGDEVNIIKPGVNYGWPIVSLGRTYTGPWQADSQRPTHDNFEPPIAYWMPAIAVSGMTFYTGDALPRWKGDVLVGALRTGEIPGTGHIERILFNQNMEELRREALLVDLHQRVRDIRQGPDELIYIATDEVDGAILRIEPAL